jgi:hypothetical protein
MYMIFIRLSGAADASLAVKMDAGERLCDELQESLTDFHVLEQFLTDDEAIIELVEAADRATVDTAAR